jgi:hypothetical protein
MQGSSYRVIRQENKIIVETDNLGIFGLAVKMGHSLRSISLWLHDARQEYAALSYLTIVEITCQLTIDRGYWLNANPGDPGAFATQVASGIFAPGKPYDRTWSPRLP